MEGHGFKSCLGLRFFKEELHNNLQLLYAKARNKDSGNYSRSMLLGFRNEMLDAKLNHMKQQGEESVKHKPCIENEDLQYLKQSTVMSPSMPHGLLNNVCFHITLYFCRWGRGGHRNLRKSSFVFLQE